jgi:hypothetical protein
MFRQIATRACLVLALGPALAMFACNGGGSDSPTPTPGAITIDAPTEGELVTMPVAVSGTVVGLEQPYFFVEAGYAEGEARCVRRLEPAAAWQTDLSIPPPVTERDLFIRAYSVNPEDLSFENRVTRRVRASAEAPPIVIEAPLCDQEMRTSLLDVSGTASVLEGSLIVELQDAAGVVVQSRTVQATAAAPERGTWQALFDVQLLTPGAYTVVAYAINAADGAKQHEFSVPIRR